MFTVGLWLLPLGVFACVVGGVFNLLWRLKLAKANEVPLVLIRRSRLIWDGTWSTYSTPPGATVMRRLSRSAGSGPGEAYRRAARLAFLIGLVVLGVSIILGVLAEA